MPRPLEGLRVADFSHVIAGPLATQFLNLLGAEGYTLPDVAVGANRGAAIRLEDARNNFFTGTLGVGNAPLCEVIGDLSEPLVSAH